jgi:DNA invertase Pin-like site-specific DNA recombinase
MKYGYARVSTDDQSAALQFAALKRAGCKTLFKDEGKSGATTKRPTLLRCLKASCRSVRTSRLNRPVKASSWLNSAERNFSARGSSMKMCWAR